MFTGFINVSEFNNNNNDSNSNNNNNNNNKWTRTPRGRNLHVKDRDLEKGQAGLP